MPTVGEIATTHPITVLTTTRVAQAARLMAELGVGDVIVTDPVTGAVAGMLTDRDIVVRAVARNRDAPTTDVSEVYTPDATTIGATEDIVMAQELMCRDSIRRIPVVDHNGKPLGIVSIEDLAASGHVTDSDLREIMKSTAAAYRANRISATKK